jgi:hypothetical protein
MKSVLTMVLLATWFACTLHCQFEKDGPFHNAAAQASIHSEAAHCDLDDADSHVCDWVTTGGLHVSDSRVSAPEFVAVPLFAFLGIVFSDLLIPPEPSSQSERSVAPPELRASFHFVFRTALPARAPSIAS